jgi:hypothetical protein
MNRNAFDILLVLGAVGLGVVDSFLTSLLIIALLIGKPITWRAYIDYFLRNS